MLRFITCLLLCSMLTSSWAQFVNPRTGAARSAPNKPAVTQPTPKRSESTKTPARRSSTKRTGTRSPDRGTTKPVTSSESDYVQIYLTNGSIVKCMWVETTPTEIIYRDMAGTIWRVPRSQVSQVVVTARAPGSGSAVMQEQKITTTTAASTAPVAAVAAPTKPIQATVVSPVSMASRPAEMSAKQKKAEQQKADKLSKADKARETEKLKREKADKVLAESKLKQERKKSESVAKQSRTASTGDAFGDGAKFLEFSLSLNGSRSKLSAPTLPDDQTNSALTISPTIRYGVFTRENVAFGGGIQATFGNDGVAATGERKTTTYSPFAFVRRYLPLNESIALYGEGLLGVDYRTEEFTVNAMAAGEQKTLTPMIRLSGGATVRLGEAWWINGQATIVGLTYNRRTFGPDTQAQANLELIGRNTRSLFTLSLVRFF